MSTILSVDVSSHNQPRTRETLDGWVSQGMQLLLIHAYTSFEATELKQTTWLWQAIAAEPEPCWALPYVWLFGAYDPAAQVQSARNTWVGGGSPSPGVMLLDCETYGPDSSGFSDPGPSAEQIYAASAACHDFGAHSIVYANLPWLQAIRGDVSLLDGMFLMVASYHEPPRPDLNIQPPYGMRLVAHQYTDKPVDWSIWDQEALETLAQGYPGASPPAPPPADPCALIRADALVLKGKADRLEAGIRFELARPRLDRKRLAKLVS